MALTAYKGISAIRPTLRKGFSVCTRFVRGETLDDSMDCFSCEAHFKTKSAAEKYIKKQLEDEYCDKRYEIIAHKIDDEPR